MVCPNCGNDRDFDLYGPQVVFIREYIRGETTDWDVDRWADRLGQ